MCSVCGFLVAREPPILSALREVPADSPSFRVRAHYLLPDGHRALRAAEREPTVVGVAHMGNQPVAPLGSAESASLELDEDLWPCVEQEDVLDDGAATFECRICLSNAGVDHVHSRVARTHTAVVPRRVCRHEDTAVRRHTQPPGCWPVRLWASVAQCAIPLGVVIGRPAPLCHELRP